jgi:pyridoxal phosphate enzyme (YggS family)
MNIIVEKFNKIKFNIDQLKPLKSVTVVAVSKTFQLSHIKPLIDYGHNHFGENKVQEAKHKWSEIKKKKQNLNLHMVGKLQSNKAKDAVMIFDYIHSLDNQKLADNLYKSQINFNKKLKYFIQVNIGGELQKSGVSINELDSFYSYCTKEIKLNILGLMCIPPNDNNAKKYFKSLEELNSSLAFKELSLGMSADYIDAINYGATFVRIGSSIFGNRG